MKAGVYVESIVAQWRDAGQRLIDRAAAQARQEGIVVTAALLEDGGRIPDVIVAESKQWPADLIVIGTHGHHGIEHLLLGSVAEGVVRTSSMPVLLIRQE